MNQVHVGIIQFKDRTDFWNSPIIKYQYKMGHNKQCISKQLLFIVVCLNALFLSAYGKSKKKIIALHCSLI